jgi:hypothetical protein
MTAPLLTKFPFHRWVFLSTVRSELRAARHSSTLCASGTATHAAQLKVIFQDTGFVKIDFYHLNGFALLKKHSVPQSLLIVNEQTPALSKYGLGERLLFLRILKSDRNNDHVTNLETEFTSILF